MWTPIPPLQVGVTSIRRERWLFLKAWGLGDSNIFPTREGATSVLGISIGRTGVWDGSHSKVTLTPSRWTKDSVAMWYRACCPSTFFPPPNPNLPQKKSLPWHCPHQHVHQTMEHQSRQKERDSSCKEVTAVRVCYKQWGAVGPTTWGMRWGFLNHPYEQVWVLSQHPDDKLSWPSSSLHSWGGTELTPLLPAVSTFLPLGWWESQ